MLSGSTFDIAIKREYKVNVPHASVKTLTYGEKSHILIFICNNV